MLYVFSRKKYKGETYDVIGDAIKIYVDNKVRQSMNAARPLVRDVYIEYIEKWWDSSVNPASKNLTRYNALLRSVKAAVSASNVTHTKNLDKWSWSLWITALIDDGYAEENQIVSYKAESKMRLAMEIFYSFEDETNLNYDNPNEYIYDSIYYGAKAVNGGSYYGSLQGWTVFPPSTNKKRKYKNPKSDKPWMNKTKYGLTKEPFDEYLKKRFNTTTGGFNLKGTLIPNSKGKYFDGYYINNKAMLARFSKIIKKAIQ